MINLRCGRHDLEVLAACFRSWIDSNVIWLISFTHVVLVGDYAGAEVARKWMCPEIACYEFSNRRVDLMRLPG
uniref:hypothetical protein n=1 Tax=Herbidospora sakaeratensis TaxID=564415 RepID=UPI0012FB77EF|nr:hypothetical protein [Herbidospora sakaeratensis]